MKRITATAVLFLTAISAPALAETPTQRELHSWGYVQSVATSAQTQPEAPAMEQHEQRPYYHHEAKHEGHHHHGKKHEGHHHHGKKHHHEEHEGHHHHHHHDKAKDETKGKEETKPAEQPTKQ